MTPREALKKRQAQERRAVGNFFAEQTKAEVKKTNANYRRRLDKLREQQRIERAAQQKRHSEQSQQRAKDIAEGKDIERFDPGAYKKSRQDKKREEFRDTGRDISKKKPKVSKEKEIPREEEISKEERLVQERERYEARERERERQRLRRRGPRPKGPKPPKFRRKF